MDEFLPFVVIGLSVGSIYGLAGVGLVLTYKTSGVFNFAYGAIAAVAAFVFYWLRVREGMDWPFAAALSVLVLGPLMGLLLELLTRALARVSTEFQIVGMVGLALGISGALTLWSSSWSESFTALSFPDFLPTETFTVGDVNVGYNQAITMGIALLSTIGLYLFFRYARLGVAMRAVVDNPELVNVTGTNPIAVRRWAWIIGTVFAAMSGVLLAPSIGLSSLLLILLVVQAFGAAAVGYFSNLPLTYLGGLAIGVAASVSTKYVGTISWLGGLPSSLPFIVLFIALLVTPKRLLTLRRAAPPPPPRTAYTAPPAVSIVIGVIVVGILATRARHGRGASSSFWTVGLLTVILFLSLGLLVRESGQVSLCQYAFAAVSAAAFCHFISDHGVPWLLALLLAGLVAVPVGLLIALPAIRLSGVFLALATLGFGIMLEKMLYLQDIMFGATAEGIHAARPSFAQSDQDYYYVVLAAAVICSIVVVAIVRGRLGRLLLGLRDSPLALDTEGATTNVTRVLVFCISAFLAGIFGALYAGFVGAVNGGTFPSFTSLTIIAVVVLAVGGAPWYALGSGRVLHRDPELHRHRQHPGIPPDLLRPGGGLRRSPRHEATFGAGRAAQLPRSSRWAETGCRRRRRRRAALGRGTAHARARDAGRERARHRRRERWATHARGGARVRARDPCAHGALRRVGRRRRAQPGGAHRSNHRFDRSERRGEDHHLQRGFGPRASESGSHRSPRQRHHAQRALSACASRPRAHLPARRAVELVVGRGERRARPGGGDGRPELRVAARCRPW